MQTVLLDAPKHRAAPVHRPPVGARRPVASPRVHRAAPWNAAQVGPHVGGYFDAGLKKSTLAQDERTVQATELAKCQALLAQVLDHPDTIRQRWEEAEIETLKQRVRFLESTLKKRTKYMKAYESRLAHVRERDSNAKEVLLDKIQLEQKILESQTRLHMQKEAAENRLRLQTQQHQEHAAAQEKEMSKLRAHLQATQKCAMHNEARLRDLIKDMGRELEVQSTNENELRKELMALKERQQPHDHHKKQETDEVSKAEVLNLRTMVDDLNCHLKEALERAAAAESQLRSARGALVMDGAHQDSRIGAVGQTAGVAGRLTPKRTSTSGVATTTGQPEENGSSNRYDPAGAQPSVSKPKANATAVSLQLASLTAPVSTVVGCAGVASAPETSRMPNASIAKPERATSQRGDAAAQPLLRSASPPPSMHKDGSVPGGKRKHQSAVSQAGGGQVERDEEDAEVNAPKGKVDEGRAEGSEENSEADSEDGKDDGEDDAEGEDDGEGEDCDGQEHGEEDGVNGDGVESGDEGDSGEDGKGSADGREEVLAACTGKQEGNEDEGEDSEEGGEDADKDGMTEGEMATEGLEGG